MAERGQRRTRLAGHRARAPPAALRAGGSRRCPRWASPRGTRRAQLGTHSTGGLGAPASASPRGASARRVAQGLHSLSSAKREKKGEKKKIYILTVTHHLPFWNLWGWCNLHKAVQKSKTILNNRGGKKSLQLMGDFQPFALRVFSFFLIRNQVTLWSCFQGLPPRSPELPSSLYAPSLPPSVLPHCWSSWQENTGLLAEAGWAGGAGAEAGPGLLVAPSRLSPPWHVALGSSCQCQERWDPAGEESTHQHV